MSPLHEALEFSSCEEELPSDFCDRYDHPTTFRGFISLWMSPGFFDLNTRVCSPVKLGRRRSWISCLCDRYALVILLSRVAKTSIFLNGIIWQPGSPQIFWHSWSSFGSPCNLIVLFVCDNNSSWSIVFLAFGSTRRTILRFNDSESFNLSRVLQRSIFFTLVDKRVELEGYFSGTRRGAMNEQIEFWSTNRAFSNGEILYDVFIAW